ncbi:MAG: DUF2599 domain-containing protein [Mycobacteriaceae bacterium]|nr:DUF2599 domain-containing protein [Mycobacteriaceae bacterium]
MFAPPLVDPTDWVRWDGLTGLHVFPTPAARVAAGQLGAAAAADQAWAETLGFGCSPGTPVGEERF